MKILYVTTISNTVNAFLIPHIKILLDQGHQVDIAFNVEQEIKPEIIEMGCKIYKIPFQKSPINKNNFKAYKLIKKIVAAEKYDLVHTHTPVASAILRLACRGLSNVKVFYTAHGFHFYKGASIKNWLVYYPVEKWLSKYTDTLITINNEDYTWAKKFFKAKRVEYIPGVGINLDKFNTLEINRSLMRDEIGLPKDAFVVLSVGELNKNKNHQAIIKAIAKTYNSDIHYVICGQGQLDKYLRNLAKKLRIEEQVHLLGYRKDIPEICKASDIFAFPSYREGLSVALMEAMAIGLPVVCSRIRGNSDMIVDGKGGFLVNANDIDGFANAIKLLSCNNKLREKFKTFNIEAAKRFDKQNIENELLKIYKEVCKND